jgi:phosphoribosylglycinamide formyltransferase-1
VIRVAILISGGGSNMVRLVQDMAGDHPGRPCLVLSNDPGASGLQKASAMGVPVAALPHRAYASRAEFEVAVQAELVRAGAEVVCLAGFMRVLTPDFVALWQGRMLNIHPSLLPKYPGLHTHARALAAGDTEAGATVHLVTPVLDDGPILGQARVPVLAGDTEATLAARVLAAEHQLYPAMLRQFLAELSRL